MTMLNNQNLIKIVMVFPGKVHFSKKATKFEEISKRQIDGEDFVDICGLFRKHEP